MPCRWIGEVRMMKTQQFKIVCVNTRLEILIMLILIHITMYCSDREHNFLKPSKHKMCNNTTSLYKSYWNYIGLGGSINTIYMDINPYIVYWLVHLAPKVLWVISKLPWFGVIRDCEVD